MPKKKTIRQSKDKAWREFSRFIRTRDAIATTGNAMLVMSVITENS